MKQLTTQIYIYDISNPPDFNKTHNFELKLSNSNILSLKKQDQNQTSSYELIIRDLASLGYQSNDDAQFQFLENVIFAFNLLTSDAVIRTKQLTKPKCNLENIHELKDHTIVTKIKNSNKVTCDIILGVETTCCISSYGLVKIDETDVIKILKLIQNSEKSSNVHLKKLLTTFKSALSSSDRIATFTNLCNALELAVNSDGKDRRGYEFLNHASSLTDMKTNVFDNWWKMYNRVKHIDENDAKKHEYDDAIQKIPSQILELKLTVQNIIINLLE